MFNQFGQNLLMDFLFFLKSGIIKLIVLRIKWIIETDIDFLEKIILYVIKVLLILTFILFLFLFTYMLLRQQLIILVWLSLKITYFFNSSSYINRFPTTMLLRILGFLFLRIKNIHPLFRIILQSYFLIRNISIIPFFKPIFEILVFCFL